MLIIRLSLLCFHRVDVIDRSMKRLGIDRFFSQKVHEYYEYVWARHRDHEGQRLISEVSLRWWSHL